MKNKPAISEVVGLDAWARLWDDPTFEGWSQLTSLSNGDPLVVDALRTLIASARTESTHRLLRKQLGRADPFRRRLSRTDCRVRWATPVGSVAYFCSAGSWLSSWSVILLCLLARCSVRCRVASEDRGWTQLLVSTLGLVDAGLADRVKLERWSSDDKNRTRELCRSSKVVIAEGSDRTMADIYALTPWTTRFIPFGATISGAIIGAGRQNRSIAKALTRDVAIYDQAGCLSPQFALTQGNQQSAIDFAHLVAEEMEHTVHNLPVEHRDPAIQSSIRNWRMMLGFVPGSEVYGPPNLRWTVAYTPEPVVIPSPGGRSLSIAGFGNWMILADCLNSLKGLGTVGAAVSTGGDRIQLLNICDDAGCWRICPIGWMQRPLLSWDHDGVALMQHLVRWVNEDLMAVESVNNTLSDEGL